MGLPQGSRGSPTCTWVTLRPRPADGEAARSKWEKPGPQLPERWEGMKTQGHAAKEQLLGPPSPSEPESEAQESARLGGSRGILTLVGTELWVPATWISARSDAGGACVQYWCFSWASLSHIQPLPPPHPTGSSSRRTARGGQGFGQVGWMCALPWGDPRVPCPGEMTTRSPAPRPSRGACHGPFSQSSKSAKLQMHQLPAGHLGPGDPG